MLMIKRPRLLTSEAMCPNHIPYPITTNENVPKMNIE